MSLTDRDRKIILALVPLAVVAAYWFLLLAPKRHEASSIQNQLTQAQTERDTAVQKAAGLTAAKRSFARDYATVIYVGKSIPDTVDMPSLLVQLDRASRVSSRCRLNGKVLEQPGFLAGRHDLRGYSVLRARGQRPTQERIVHTGRALERGRHQGVRRSRFIVVGEGAQIIE